MRFFFMLCLIYLGCWIGWGCVWIYSYFFNKGKTRWLKPVLVAFGLVGISPLLIYIGSYTLRYATSHPTVSRVSGTYHGSFHGEKDTLTLQPNGAFNQRFVTSTGKVYTHTGTWELQTIDFNPFDLDDSDTVAFDKLIVHISGTGKREKPEFDLDNSPQEVDSSQICFTLGDPDSEPNCFTR